MITRTQRYSPLKRLGLESVYPVVEGYKDVVAYGVHARFSDPVLLNGIGVTAAFSPASSLPLSERGHLRVDYRRFDWNAHAALEQRRLLRSLRPDEDEPPRLRSRRSATPNCCSSTSRAA